MAVNCELSISGTSVVLNCGAGDAAAVLCINGKMRTAEASKSVNMTGQPANTYGIYVTTTADDNDSSFAMSLSVAAPGGTYVRQIGSVVWSGSALSDLRQSAGYEKHAFMHATQDPLPADTIAASQLTTGAREMLVPTGAVIDFAGSAVPSGFLDCNGAAVSRSTYSALFGVIGVAYGPGDGTTTFNLPDARGRASVGAGQGTGLTDRVLAAQFGAETHVLTVSQMPSHSHGAATGSAGTHSHGGATQTETVDHTHNYLATNNQNLRYGTDSGNLFVNVGANVVQTGGISQNHVHGILSDGAHTHTVSAEGGGASHPNTQPSIVFKKIIKT